MIFVEFPICFLPSIDCKGTNNFPNVQEKSEILYKIMRFHQNMSKNSRQQTKYTI